jgi:osmotically-inducible protein OsmY
MGTHLMAARDYDQRIEARILRMLSRVRPHTCCELMVAATPDGTVYLNGLIPSEAERLNIEQSIRDVPGVTRVIFNSSQVSTHNLSSAKP